MTGITERVAVRRRERGECVSRKRIGDRVESKEGEHWLQSPTKVEVRSEHLEKEGKRTLAQSSDESRGAIRTPRKDRRKDVGSNPRRKSRCDPNAWKR